MLQSNHELVREFHDKFGLPNAKTPQLLPAELSELAGPIASFLKACEGLLRHGRGPTDVFYGRVQMMLEELREFVEAHERGDLAAAADSLVDLEYFLHGTAAMMGFPHDEIFAEVHAANMCKVRVESVSESKRLNKLDVKKPEGWQPPDVAGILARRA
jgi:hypothetical protein